MLSVGFVVTDDQQVDYYNYRDPAPPELVDALDLKTDVIMASGCNAIVPAGMIQGPFPNNAEILDMSGCVCLDGPTLSWILRSNLRIIGLLDVRDLPSIMAKLSTPDLALFYEKAVWLPIQTCQLQCSESVLKRHFEFVEIIQAAYTCTDGFIQKK